MFKDQNLKMFGLKLFSNTSDFHPPEVVGRGNESQF